MDRTNRPSTEEERTPLMDDRERGRHSREPPDQSFADRISSLAQEPLTPLTQVLLILVLFLLLLSSIFIGLFAGAQHKLDSGQGRRPDGGGGRRPPVITSISRITTIMTTTAMATTTAHDTVTATAGPTATATRTITATSGVGTSIATSVITATHTATATRVVTTTVPGPPVPGPSNPPNPPKDIPCLDPKCIVLSASILASLDTTQDPCENFYDFANGGWLKAHPLPADKSSYGNFEALAQQNKQVIQRILESRTTSDALGSNADKEVLGKIRDFYSACLDEDRLDGVGSTPLLHVVRVIRRLYREEDTDISSEFTQFKKVGSNGLTAALAYLHSRGVDALFSFDVEGDVGDDPNRMALWFSQPPLGLPTKEYYDDEGIAEVYRGVLERLFLTLTEEEDLRTQSHILVNNDDETVWPPWPWPPWDDDGDDGGGKKPSNRSRQARHLAKEVFRFESGLAEASLDLDVLYQDPIATYNPVPISDFTKDLPQIDFPSYFSTFTPRNYPEQVIVTYPKYIKSLSDLLDDTSSEVIEAYLVVQAALGLSSYLGKTTAAWQAVRALEETLTGVKKGAYGDRAEYCVGQVESALGFAAGRYFVNETFGGDSKDKGTRVITNIVGAFKESLRDLEWMDKKSAKAAAEKADAIRVKVGYPLSPNTRNPESIAQYYNKVKVDQFSFFDNTLSAVTSEKFKMWLTLGQRRNLESWEMFPSTVNAYFNPPANEIVFPAGILQPPFFSRDWPAYLSYGSFGHVAAHELTHAFDSAGRMYNQDGKLEEWWTDSTSAGFQKRQDCIINQYSKYTIDDGKGGHIHVNGNLTSGENIGDTGLIQAYRAWKANYEESFQEGNEYALPGLDYTREQLFFISFARIWARNLKPEAAVQRIRSDPHSPSRYRVDGTVSNIPEFAKAFKCSSKAKLNPPRSKQCIFW